jgi:MFS family permease
LSSGGERKGSGSSGESDLASVIGPRAVTRSTVVLIALRVGYAYNWFSVGPALPEIGSTFHVGPEDWGILVAAFLVGAGLFQVPAGLLARRYGARAVSLWGVGLLAAGGIASAVSPSFVVLLALRLASGVGAALFFSPAIGLVGSLYPTGRRGVPVGTFSSAFSLGAALGIVGTAVLLPPLGWRGAILFGGALLGVLTLLGVAAIPRAAGGPPTERPRRGGIPAALRFRGVWAVGIGFIGYEGATFATGQFIVPWGESVRAWSIVLAGVVGMMFVLPSVAGGPVGGYFAERFRNHRTQLVLAAISGAVVLALLPIAGLAAAIAIGFAFSFGYGIVYAVMYVLPHFWREVPEEEIPLGIGLFNSIQLAGGAGVSFLFGWLVETRSYGLAWEILPLVAVSTLVALLALPASRAAAGAGPRRGAASAPP